MRVQWTRDLASLGRSPRSITLLVLVLAGHELACRPSEPKPEGRVRLEPVRPTESVATVAAIRLDTEPTWTPEPPQPTRVVTPVIAAAPAEIPTKRPTLDLASIRSLDRPRDPTGPPGAAGIAGLGGFKLDQADFNDPVYIERMVRIIGLNWFKPAQSVKANPVVHFQIERDGTIVDARVVASSGLPFVDRAALRAVIASSPLPPLPAKYPWPHLGIQVVFD